MASNDRWWRFRLQIWTTELEADTQPGELPGDRPLELSAKGSLAMMTAVSELLHDFHGKPYDTMDGARVAELMMRIPTLRVYLSNRGGKADIRIPYTPDGSSKAYGVLYVERGE